MSKAKKETANQDIPAANVIMRFVYEHEIKGEWVNVFEAWQNGFITPNSTRIPIRVEFEQIELPPRVRQSE